MSAALKQRARIARVRRLQHNMAASSAAAAAGQLRELEGNSDRLARMRLELGASEGQTSGAWLAAAGELALRLESARFGLAPTIDAARQVATLKEQARVSARQSQESAERLEQAAARDVADLAERRGNRAGRKRAYLGVGEMKS